MLKAAKDLQNNAVSELITAHNKRKETTFKAPTGSGKTYMMAAFMDKVLAAEPDTVFLVSSLSKGDLAEQNYDQFLTFQSNGRFPHLDPYLISTIAAKEERIFIPPTYNVYVLPRDLYKNGGRLMQGAMEGFLQKMTGGALAGGLGKKIVLIKDECHIATSNLDNISTRYFSKILNFSATPKLSRGQQPDVVIKDQDAVDAHLIKRVEWGPDNDTLEDAILKYKALKNDYVTKLGVNPCLIIQISNKDKAEEEWRDIIEPVLTKHDIQWMYIVDKDKDCKTNTDLRKVPVRLWKKYAKEDISPVEVIIFKLAISEGWDIRRACMLYQIRDTQSEQLDEQVIGRVRRNPRLMDYETLPDDAKALADVAYVWGVKPKDLTVYVPVELRYPGNAQNEIKIKTTRLKGLKDKSGFDLADVISKNAKKEAASIFDLYAQYDNLPDDIKELGRAYITSYSAWRDFTKASSAIQKEYRAKVCDYSTSMELSKEEDGSVKTVSFPTESLYNETKLYITISNNVWRRKDGNDSFSFDSEAEREWADILKDFAYRHIKKDPAILDEHFLWGKNYLPNSEINYEYYLDGVHKSYPDFVMKDNFDRIHLFEVKSVNGNDAVVFDTEAYKNKIDELKKCYKQASLLTNQAFYLPVKTGNTWQITRFIKGVEDTISKEQLKTALLTR